MGSLALEEELKNAICDAQIYFSVTLKLENLSPEAEKQRQELGQRFESLKSKYQLGGKKEELPPPRPPKNVGLEEPELYDDVVQTDQKVNQTDQQEDYDDVAKPVPHHNAQEENYEMMNEEKSTEYSKAGEEPSVNTAAGKKDEPITEENYAEPEQEPEEYEIVLNERKEAPAAVEGQSNTSEEQQETYEICETDAQKDGSLSANLANLFQKVKSNEIQSVTYRGYLNKHRKPGKMFIGSRWQKRYCVVTDYFMYYFKTEKAQSQKGSIILPGYSVTITSHKNEHEFELTQDGYRSYKFSCENKEEFDKCVEAVKKSSSRKLSGKESKTVEKILSQGDSSNDEDTSSITNDDLQPGNDAGKESRPSPSLESASRGSVPESAEEEEEMYELVGNEAKENKKVATAQPQTQKPPVAIAGDEDQEMYDDVASSAPVQKPAPSPPPQNAEEEEDLYELVGVEAKNASMPSQSAPRIEEPPPSSRIAVQPPSRLPETQLSSAAPALPPLRTPEMQKTSPGPALPPPRGSERSSSSGPALPPPRGSSSLSAPALPPPRSTELPSNAPDDLPPRASQPPLEELREEDDGQEVYDDVASGRPSEQPSSGPSLPPPRESSSSSAPALPPSRSSEPPSDAPDRPPPRTSKPPVEELREEDEGQELYDDVASSHPPEAKGGVTVGVDDELPPPPSPSQLQEPEEAPPRPGPKPSDDSSPVRPPRKSKPEVPIRTTPVTPKPTSSTRQPEVSSNTTPKPVIHPKPKGVGQSAAPAQELKPEPSKDIDYSRVYMAIWNCKADSDDELEFTRGDLLYIYEQLQDGWWVGSLIEPQGYTIGLVPNNYLKEAFDLNSWKREVCA